MKCNILYQKGRLTVSAYISKYVEFRRKPPKLTITLPKFIPHKINKEHAYQQFGSLTSSLIESEKHGYKMDDPGVKSSPSNKDLLHEPRVITQTKTAYAYTCNLSCLTDEDIWVRGNSNILRLYNLQRGIMKSIQTYYRQPKSDPTADFNNHRIHILDEDGQFIDNCHLDSPFGLSLDTEDNLFVAESKTCKVKNIQYCK